VKEGKNKKFLGKGQGGKGDLASIEKAKMKGQIPSCGDDALRGNSQKRRKKEKPRRRVQQRKTAGEVYTPKEGYRMIVEDRFSLQLSHRQKKSARREFGGCKGTTKKDRRADLGRRIFNSNNQTQGPLGKGSPNSYKEEPHKGVRLCAMPAKRKTFTGKPVQTLRLDSGVMEEDSS